MMKILGLDTSTLTGSVGLVEGERPIAEATLCVDVTHSERLLEAVDLLFKGARCNLKDVGGFAVSHGPGSFTGIRIGLSVVKGLAMATQRPVFPISSLEVLAQNVHFTNDLVCPLIDARKKEVYAALFRWSPATEEMERLTEDALFTPQSLMSWLRTQLCDADVPRGGNPIVNRCVLFVGDGVPIHGPILQEGLGSAAVLAPPWKGLPSGISVAQLGYRASLRGSSVDSRVLVPAYIQEFPRK